MELAQAIEAADQNAKAMKGTEAAVQKLTVSSKHRSPCYRCGKSNHDAKDCRFRDANCKWCGKKGHIASACRSRKAGQKSIGRKPNGRSHRRILQNTKWITTGGSSKESAESDSEEFQVFTIAKKSSHPIQVTLLINGKQLNMEVDTGAAVSIISERTTKAMFPDAHLNHSRSTPQQA